MPKITFPNPADATYLETAGDNIYTQSGRILIRKKPKQTHRRTTPRTTTRDNLKTLSLFWANLSTAEKTTWDNYRQFIKNNTQLLRPAIPTINALRTIITTPPTPAIPTGFNAYFLQATAELCVTWTDTYAAGTYIKAWAWRPPGRQRRSSQPFTYLQYAPSTDEHLIIDIDNLDVPRPEQVTIRALNLCGEVSPFTATKEIPKTSYRAAKYAYSNYGWSRYGS